MGKNKLRKFAEMEQIDFVLQYPFATLQKEEFPYKGKWHEEFFHNSNPIVLELGCGKGEYTVGLARRFPDKNFIGVDIKGARMWTGAKEALRDGMTNVAFLRTSIELITHFFAPGEVAEIWITFPDPQMKKVNKRLTSTRFLELYRRILCPGGTIHLKTDSPFLYTYTRIMAEHNGLSTTALTDDLYHCSDLTPEQTDLLGIRTYYEQQWLDRGLTIKYIAFPLDQTTHLSEPEVEIEFDTYRSFSRGQIQCPHLCQPKVTLSNSSEQSL
ncbi:MAG: tRNA (guanosine(46)-N7)-methyltransferase TrmB [Paramuribaculum sp.]|nr:tRNA (guanosine(46)-N7)-methyltransferase TrmB [Paramuribaculum sp.]